MKSLAIIGTGIAGMGCAHFLQRDFDLTIFEQDARVGGHSHTVTALETKTGDAVAVDTGFMVFNRVTYPLLCRLFEELHVPVKRTDMSFSVCDEATGLEWCGSSLNHLFAQRRNLLRPRFWRMLRQIDRFNREALDALHDPEIKETTLGDYVRRRGYGEDFFNLYLLPMSSAVWSTSPRQMLQFPATSLLRFFHNHGFLGLHTQHPWWTVTGGSREYVRRLIAPWRHRIQVGEGAARIQRSLRGVAIETTAGRTHRFDRVIIAAHADQALRLLADPTPDERKLLGEFHYQRNDATVHTDTRVMPRAPLAWASWNYRLTPDSHGGTEPATHYWMNRLQGVSEREDFFVSINGAHRIAPEKVQRRLVYDHPLFNPGAVRAQASLPALNDRALETTRTFFAGSYFRHGFHEDAFMSAVHLSELLLQRDPWRSTAALEGEAPAGPETSPRAISSAGASPSRKATPVC